MVMETELFLTFWRARLREISQVVPKKIMSTLLRTVLHRFIAFGIRSIALHTCIVRIMASRKERIQNI